MCTLGCSFSFPALCPLWGSSCCSAALMRSTRPAGAPPAAVPRAAAPPTRVPSPRAPSASICLHLPMSLLSPPAPQACPPHTHRRLAALFPLTPPPTRGRASRAPLLLCCPCCSVPECSPVLGAGVLRVPHSPLTKNPAPGPLAAECRTVQVCPPLTCMHARHHTGVYTYHLHTSEQFTLPHTSHINYMQTPL